jgi:hypothetical protein
MSPSPSRLACVLFSAWAVGAACTPSERPPRIEDEARAMAPVPACVVPLPPRAHGAGVTMRNLTELQYWQLVFPAFDSTSRRLPLNAAACTGARVFDEPAFAGGTTRGSPIEVQDGDVVYGNGGERVRIVWLRTHRWPDGSQAGPLALVRAKEDFAEVYAVGAYRSATSNTTLQAERLGFEVLVSATDDGCQGQAQDATCETNVSLFLPRFGRLGRLTTMETTRRAYATGSEPGVQGPVEYVLTASPQYTADGIKLFEQVKATDSSGRVVHRTELERTFVLHDGVLDQGTDSLWGRVYPGQARTR